MSQALCVDLGGSNLRVGLLREGDRAPRPIGHWPTPVGLDDFRARVGSLAAAHEVSSIGIAVPGLASGSRCLWLPNLPFMNGVDLSELFPNTAIALGNDAHLALLAEAAKGAAMGVSNAILLAIGTGIGSAVLSDGKIVVGSSGGATSFGWACADPADPGDELHGWLERNASGRALDKIAHSTGLASGAALVERARGGDHAASEALLGPAAALAATLAGAVALLGSSTIIISGGVTESMDVIGPLILPFLKRHLPPHLRQVTLTKAAFGMGASLAGAGFAAQGNPLWPEHRS